MAASLKVRVGRIIAGGVHALIDRIEDQAPQAVMEQAIRDADGVINDVRHELGLVSANRHLAQQQHAKLNGQHESLTAQIDDAVSAQREDLMRVAVARQLDIEAQIPVLEATLAEYARQEIELQGYVTALLAKRREMEEALADLRKSRATVSTQSSTGAGAHETGERMEAATDAFNRIYERQTGLSGTARGIGIHEATKLKELDDLTRENKIVERIARLKAARA